MAQPPTQNNPHRNQAQYDNRLNEFRRLGSSIPAGPVHNVCRGALSNLRRFDENQFNGVEAELARVRSGVQQVQTRLQQANAERDQARADL